MVKGSPTVPGKKGAQRHRAEAQFREGSSPWLVQERAGRVQAQKGQNVYRPEEGDQVGNVQAKRRLELYNP